MNNPKTLVKSDTQDRGRNKHQSKQKGQTGMNNTETLATSDTQDRGRNKHQSKQKGQSEINTKNEQQRDTDNIWIHKTQDKINTRVNRRDNQE